MLYRPRWSHDSLVGIETGYALTNEYRALFLRGKAAGT
jgi:hypothetical protein